VPLRASNNRALPSASSEPVRLLNAIAPSRWVGAQRLPAQSLAVLT
jgi:hypothetical protein